MGGETYDVSVIGPGAWTMIHMLAAEAQTPTGARLFTDFMAFLAANFPCEKCRLHIEKFLKTHPFCNYTNEYIDGKEIGYFRLSWYMHSAVNERLGKPFFPFETAYTNYFKKDTCMDICPGVIEDITTATAQQASGRSKLAMIKSSKKKTLTIKR
jgi:hypothetical protein